MYIKASDGRHQSDSQWNAGALQEILSRSAILQANNGAAVLRDAVPSAAAVRATQDEPAPGASASAQSPVLALSSRGEAILEVSMHLRRGRLLLRLPATDREGTSPSSDTQLLSKVIFLKLIHRRPPPL